ncbi:hypothetical protein KFZ56_19010 [Virgibacillus sp. NKC19-3]|uniref:hypothetical protein n=1 Tax=Virgibacillus saliphilus TaxID=2831674 RepID=UPI001C9AD501|nr:hypothetical protein [Virgibacillus sp. NKC19-3]MBY7145112.1 hypothetical protein [Virgibacillus sp. NKC19-3]
MLLNISLMIVIVAGLFLSIYGLQKKSQLPILSGGIAFLAPIMYFMGWMLILPLVPPIALVLSIIGIRKVNPA